MARKGYYAELKAKKELIKQFGKQNVIKCAIGQAMDYIVLWDGLVDKFVEIKECHANKYNPSTRDKRQAERIIELAKEHNCTAERWVKYPRKPFEIQQLYGEMI